MTLKKQISPQQFVQLLNIVRNAYLDEGGRRGYSKLYRDLVDVADAAGFKQELMGQWTVGEVEEDTMIVVGMEVGK